MLFQCLHWLAVLSAIYCVYVCDYEPKGLGVRVCVCVCAYMCGFVCLSVCVGICDFGMFIYTVYKIDA